MNKILIYVFLICGLTINAQSKILEISIELYECPQKEQATFEDLTFIESKLFKFNSIQTLELLTGSKGVDFHFTKDYYKNLDIHFFIKKQ